MAEIVAGEGHNGGAISAKVGDHIAIQLPENPTTGFQWHAERADLGVLKLQSDEFAQAASGAVGSGGLRTLRYLASGAGETSITLQLARPWEANAPRSQFKIQVAVSR
jgi:inhibitor of cysteine peptidase